MSTNSIDNLGYSPAIATLASTGVPPAGSANGADDPAMNIHWFSALDASSSPVSVSARRTGYSDVDSLAQAILGKLGSPD